MLATVGYIICIGLYACSGATTQSCSVALGYDTQFPEGPAGNHVLVTPEGVRPLRYLDGNTVAMINRELERTMGGLPLLSPRYVQDWNDHCAGDAPSLVS